MRIKVMADSTEPHHLGHRARLRERFTKTGTDGLADYEVVELLLTLVIPRQDVKQPAKHLIERFGNLQGILTQQRHRTSLGHNYDTLDELTQLLFIFEHFGDIVGPAENDL